MVTQLAFGSWLWLETNSVSPNIYRDLDHGTGLFRAGNGSLFSNAVQCLVTAKIQFSVRQKVMRQRAQRRANKFSRISKRSNWQRIRDKNWPKLCRKRGTQSRVIELVFPGRFVKPRGQRPMSLTNTPKELRAIGRWSSVANNSGFGPWQVNLSLK